MTVKEIVADWLWRHHYDGLYTEECGCLAKDELMPCGEDGRDCEAGYYREAEPDTGYDYFIGPKRTTGGQR